jgi:endoglucanase
VATATPTPRLAVPNLLRTAGARILDATGHEVTLTGINWFGMETETLAPHGLWARRYGDMLDQIVQTGLNCLRVPYSNDLFDPSLHPSGIDFVKNPELQGLSGLEILDTIVVAAGRRGLKIILDRHRPSMAGQSPLWYTDHVSADVWINDWQALAQRYLGNDAVIGADLHNEPAGPATWGSGDPKTDWAIAAETCGNAILEVNLSWLILVEGVEKLVDRSGNPVDWTWQGGELMGAKTRPIQLKVPNRLVYSPHDYGPSVSDQGWFHDPQFPDNLPSFWDAHWGYLHKSGIAPILVGEFGGPTVGGDVGGVWQRSLVAYLKANGMHYAYWCLNPNSGDTGGLLEDDWQAINPGKLALLQTYDGARLSVVTPNLVNGTTKAPATAETTLPLATPSATARTPTQTPAPRARIYMVRAGDTLSGIALKLYGDSTAWRKIAAANAATLPNPSLLHVGQQLIIP